MTWIKTEERDRKKAMSVVPNGAKLIRFWREDVRTDHHYQESNPWETKSVIMVELEKNGKRYKTRA